MKTTCSESPGGLDAVKDARSTLLLHLAEPMPGGHTVPQELATRFPRSTVIGMTGAAVFARQGCRRAFTLAAELPDNSFRVYTADHGPETSIGLDLAGRITRMENLNQVAGVLLMVGADMDGEALVRAMNTMIHGNVPLVGGAASRHRAGELAWISWHGGVHTRGAMAVVFRRPLNFRHGWGNGWSRCHSSQPLRVTKASGHWVHEISGHPALPAALAHMGGHGPLARSEFFDRNPLALGDPTGTRPDRIRAALAIEGNAIRFSAQVPTGSTLFNLQTSPDRLVEASSRAIQTASAGAPGGGLAIVFPCVGHRAVNGNQSTREAAAIIDAAPPGAAILGAYSHGEIAPLQDGAVADWLAQSTTALYLWED